jgi:hypothetical protein
MQTVAGLAAFPYFGALIWAGAAGAPWYSIFGAAVIGVALYLMYRPSSYIRLIGGGHALQAAIVLYITQVVPAGIFFGLGRLFS